MASPTPEKCGVCMSLPAEFCRALCPRCREQMASFILDSAPAAVARCWHVSDRFAAIRTEMVKRTETKRKKTDASAFPEGATTAAIAAGLHDIEQFDEAVVVAALAIKKGISSDKNEFGASAVGVLLRPNLATADLFDQLRTYFQTQ
jgi:hypothetical protein